MNSVTFEKVRRVINSCKTHEQLKIARKYYAQAINQLTKRKGYNSTAIFEKEQFFYKEWYDRFSKLVWEY